jgi:hypothetical protein
VTVLHAHIRWQMEHSPRPHSHLWGAWLHAMQPPCKMGFCRLSRQLWSCWVAGDYQGSRYAGGRDQEETGLAGVSGFGHTTAGGFVGGAAFQYSVLLTGLGTMLCLQAGQPAPAASVVLLVPW